MVLECRSPPTKTKRVKGARGAGEGEMGVFPGKKKRKTLSNGLEPAEKNPLLLPSLRLLTCLACCSSSTERFFSRLPPTVGRKLAEQEQQEEEEEWVPQRQRTARRLALPVQWGEETAGHVGLSYVLTCPSLPPLKILSLALTGGNSARLRGCNFYCQTLNT